MLQRKVARNEAARVPGARRKKASKNHGDYLCAITTALRLTYRCARWT